MENFGSLLLEIEQRLEASGRLVLATVIRTRGSTPRKPGARMLIDPGGGSLGTIGGGCGEAEVFSRAQKVLATGVPVLAEIRLLEDQGWESGSVCGGVLDVWIERFSTAASAAFLAAAKAAREAQAPVFAVTAMDGGQRGLYIPPGEMRLSLGSAQDAALQRALTEAPETPAGGAALVGAPESGRFWIESLALPPELVVVGAGHVGASLARMATEAGFLVRVLEDRESFANPERLPGVARIQVGDPVANLLALPPHADRAFVFVTRGHRLDADCLAASAAQPAVYRGMIGSRRRVRRIREYLSEQGVAAGVLDALHAPIGLDIGAETPGEIAVAILAEIIQLRRAGR
ncbi:MAG: XdhC family protein [Deltaproteobacteria bacterium]